MKSLLLLHVFPAIQGQVRFRSTSKDTLLKSLPWVLTCRVLLILGGLTGGEENGVVVVGNRRIGLLWVSSRHHMIVAIEIRCRLGIVYRCQQLRAHVGIMSARRQIHSPLRQP